MLRNDGVRFGEKNKKSWHAMQMPMFPGALRREQGGLRCFLVLQAVMKSLLLPLLVPPLLLPLEEDGSWLPPPLPVLRLPPFSGGLSPLLLLLPPVGGGGGP